MLDRLRNDFQLAIIVLCGGLAAVAILPPLILFILAQRYFVEGIANTGLK